MKNTLKRLTAITLAATAITSSYLAISAAASNTQGRQIVTNT